MRVERERLGNVSGALICGRGLLGTRREVGVRREKLIETLAENTLQDEWCARNPVPVREKRQVFGIFGGGVGGRRKSVEWVFCWTKESAKETIFW